MLVQAVKVRANVIDWTKCLAENTGLQSMLPLNATSQC